jgi:hypothetical protein
MITDSIERTLLQMINSNDIKKLQSFLITEEAGKYHLFNDYVIEKQDDNVLVSVNRQSTSQLFSNIKNAVAWCIFNKRNKYYEATRIVELDRRLVGLEMDIKIHKKLFLKSKEEMKLLYFDKLTEDKLKKTHLTEYLNSYIVESTRWQRKRFEQIQNIKQKDKY